MPSHSVHLVFLLCAEDPTLQTANFEETMLQRMLTYDGETLRGLHYSEVNYVDGHAVSIFDESKDRKVQIDFPWVPSTVCTIFFRENTATSGLETRMLPKGLTLCTVIDCSVRGTIDLPHLPRTMETFELGFNFLSGTAALLDLPASLKRIDLRMNCIAVVVCDSSCFPDAAIVVVASRNFEKVRYVGIGKSKRPAGLRIS